MQVLPIHEIEARALEANSANKSWHFHILTPTCKFNDRQEYALVLELDNNVAVHYSDKPENELGKKLAPLMHKADVLNQEDDSSYYPSGNMKMVIDRARELNSKGIKWHHHLISRDCVFSSDDANYSLVFEDPELGIIEHKSADEPIDDLKLIEPLFYSQNQ